jgi:hypothetical protein
MKCEDDLILTTGPSLFLKWVPSKYRSQGSSVSIATGCRLDDWDSGV